MNSPAISGSGSGGLPGWLRQLAEVAPGLRVPELARSITPADQRGRPSAVLVAFTESPAGPSVILIQRSAQLRAHPGQVAFPGGAVEPGDPDRVATALREAQEEVGLDPSWARVFAVLPGLYLARSAFLVTPVLAWLPSLPRPLVAGDPAEVARVATVPIAELVEPANRFTVTLGDRSRGPGFDAAGVFVWGFTGYLLDRLLEHAGWARPWDASRQRPVPPGQSHQLPPVAG